MVALHPQSGPELSPGQLTSPARRAGLYVTACRLSGIETSSYRWRKRELVEDDSHADRHPRSEPWCCSSLWLRWVQRNRRSSRGRRRPVFLSLRRQSPHTGAVAGSAAAAARQGAWAASIWRGSRDGGIELTIRPSPTCFPVAQWPATAARCHSVGAAGATVVV